MIGNRKERKLSYCYLKTLSSKDERKNYLYVEYYGNLVGSKFRVSHSEQNMVALLR